MANGIPYFPLDVCVDDKIELIEAEFGLKGFAVIVKLYQKIYGGFGYYCEWTTDVGMLFSRKIGEGYTFVSEIVSAAIKRGIFDKDLYEKYQILTSEGVQKRYFSAVSRRKQVNVENAYLLIKVTFFSDNANILSENVSKKHENVCNFEQRKEDKSKVKKSIKREKEKKSLSDACANVLSLLENTVGTLSARACDEISSWLDECDVSVIEYAIEQAQTYNKRSFGYIRTIVNRCIKEKCTTRADCENTNKPQKDNSKYALDDMAAIERQKRLEKIRRGQGNE